MALSDRYRFLYPPAKILGDVGVPRRTLITRWIVSAHDVGKRDTTHIKIGERVNAGSGGLVVAISYAVNVDLRAGNAAPSGLCCEGVDIIRPLLMRRYSIFAKGCVD